MLRFEEIVFGPIHSRRLGSSLGVNLLPAKGKFCNFDCVYCECGWNRDGVCDHVLPRLEDVRAAMQTKLESCLEEGMRIDSITFSGNGEPTLNPDFPQIVDMVLAMRDRYYPDAVVSVLSNATMISRPEIAAALMKVDNPILKLDAPTDEGVLLVNRPSCRYSVNDIVGQLGVFNGNFVLQTMFLKWEGFDTSKQVAAWMDMVRKLRPREVMVYTLDRETPQKDLQKFTVEEMTSMVQPLIDEGFKVQIKA